MSHTSTPWATATGDETKIVYRPSPYAYDRQVVAEGLSPSDARHIVACVNACAGMDDPATEIARLREVNAALFQTVHAITLLRDSVDETDEDYLRACQCPECKQPWTVRECRVMLDKLAGGCMCGKWSFDARAAIAKAEEKP